MKFKRYLILAAAVALATLFATCGAFAEEPYAPKPGDPVRKAVMDGLREWVMENHDLKVIFVVDHLLVADGWAWTETKPQSGDGKQKYEPIAALLRKTAQGWQVVHVPSMEEDDPPADDEYFEGLLEEMPEIPRGIFPWGGKTSGKIKAAAPTPKTTASSGEKPYTPKPGNSVRKAVMDGLRGWMKESYDIDVVFVIDHLLVADGWAWTNTRPQSADGKNRYDRVMALLSKGNAGWRVEFVPSLEKGAPPVDDAFFNKLLGHFPDAPKGIFPWGGRQSK